MPDGTQNTWRHALEGLSHYSGANRNFIEVCTVSSRSTTVFIHVMRNRS